MALTDWAKVTSLREAQSSIVSLYVLSLPLLEFNTHQLIIIIDLILFQYYHIVPEPEPEAKAN
jgi:hypothetical protein